MLIFFISSTPFVPKWIVSSVGNMYPVLNLQNIDTDHKEVDIIVLGGGYTFEYKFPPNSQLSENALGRLVEGIRLHRQIPGSTLIPSDPESKENSYKPKY